MDTVNTKAAVQAAPIAPAISQAPQVYAAINAIQAELSREGITKDRVAKGFATYNFRGIDDIYNALSPLLARHGLVIAPRFENRQLVERIAKGGNALYYITLTGHFDFISSKDGSKHTVTTFGEAMDSGDKGTNKAMSIAYKYACLQVFAIPTEGDNDPDSTGQPPIQPSSNQTQVGQAQRITNPPLRLAPVEYIAVTDANGKSKTSDGRRVFSSEQFQGLEQAILAGQYSIDKFMDSEKYYYSEAQFNALNQLANNNRPALG